MSAAPLNRPSRRHAFLLRQLVKRDFLGRYAGSLLGFSWSFALPLWLLLLFTFVFSTVMKVSPGADSRTESFAIFLFAGLLPWMAVYEGVLRSTTAVTDNAPLVRKLSFPSELLVLAPVLAALSHAGIAAAVFLTFLLWAGLLSWASLPILLIALPLQVMLTLGLGLLLAPAHVLFRDTGQIVGLLLQGWFFLTPIVYPPSLVPERLQTLLFLNPLTTLVALYRQALLGGEPARLAPDLLFLATVALGVLILGRWTFYRLEPSLVDEI